MEGLSRHCPLLQASYLETLRLHSASSTIRNITKDIVVTESATDSLTGREQSYLLEKDMSVTVCSHLHQSDPRFFERPQEFRPERFLTSDVGDTKEKRNGNENGTKVKPHTMTPFGGGSSEFIFPASPFSQLLPRTTTSSYHSLSPLTKSCPRKAICPGRLYAATETVLFAAAILTSWDMEPCGDKEWRVPSHQSGSGVLRPVGDLRVRIRARGVV